MEELQSVVKASDSLKTDMCAMREYVNCFDKIVRGVESENIYDLMQKDSQNLFFLLPLYVGTLFRLKKYAEITELMNGMDLSGTESYSDFFNSKLIKYFYLSSKYLGRNTEEIYSLLISNKERGNKYSIAVINNCILDMQINNNIYYVPDCCEEGVTEEAARHAFYLGYVSLVKGVYKRAQRLFAHAEVVTKSRKLLTMLKKCMIVTKLLSGDHAISYRAEESLRPYFALVDAVRQGDAGLFERTLNTYTEEFFSLNLYFVVRRCIRNLLLEGLRKVSLCYSRIDLADINRILEIKADYLLRVAIQQGLVNGRIENNVFYGAHQASIGLDLGEKIREAIDLRRHIGTKMKYPEMPSLTYENVIEAEKNVE